MRTLSVVISFLLWMKSPEASRSRKHWVHKQLSWADCQLAASSPIHSPNGKSHFLLLFPLSIYHYPLHIQAHIPLSSPWSWLDLFEGSAGSNKEGVCGCEWPEECPYARTDKYDEQIWVEMNCDRTSEQKDCDEIIPGSRIINIYAWNKSRKENFQFSKEQIFTSCS